MGSSPAQIETILADAKSRDLPQWYIEESPREFQHRVRITRPFYLGTYELTQHQD